MYIDGYTFFAHNRKNLNRHAKRDSGGVGVFVKAKLFELYDISVIDDGTEDILWLKFNTDTNAENIILCVCYLPPAEYTRLNDP